MMGLGQAMLGKLVRLNICLTLKTNTYINLTDFLINKLKIRMLQGAPPVSEGSHTGALEV